MSWISRGKERYFRKSEYPTSHGKGCLSWGIPLADPYTRLLFLHGVYIDGLNGARFRWVEAPTTAELTALAHTMALRIGRYIKRQGLLERDIANSYLSSDALDEDSMHQLLGHSIAYGSAPMLAWMVQDKAKEPHVPVCDKTERKDCIFSRSNFPWDEQANEYRCPEGKPLRCR